MSPTRIPIRDARVHTVRTNLSNAPKKGPVYRAAVQARNDLLKEYATEGKTISQLSRIFGMKAANIRKVLGE